MNIYKVMLRDRRDEVVEADRYRREGEQYVFEFDGDPDVRFFLVSEVIGIWLVARKDLDDWRWFVLSVSDPMNTARRKLIVAFTIFSGVMVATATGVVAYAAYQMQVARSGDVFDIIGSERAQTWIVPTLIVIGGISIVGFLLFVGLFIFRGKESAKV